MTITMTMDEETATVLMNAAEFYGRVICGQYEEIANQVMKGQMKRTQEREGDEAVHAQFQAIMDRRDHALFLLEQAQKMQFPELENLYHHHGFGYSRETDLSYNIYQAVRYALAWHRHPEGGIGVNFDAPTADHLPYPGVAIDGKQYLKGKFDRPGGDGH